MTDTLELLEASLDRIEPALQARALGAILGKVSEKTQDYARQAQRCEALVALAATLGGLKETNVLIAVKGVVQSATKAGEDLSAASDKDDLEDILDEYGQLPNALGRLDQTLRQLWSERSRTDYFSLIAVGDLLKRLSGADALGESLAQVGRRAEALSNRNQPAETMAVDIASLKAERETLLVALSAFTAHPEVDSFIAAVTGGRATLDLVTPAVFAWLSEHDALQAFKVTG